MKTYGRSRDRFVVPSILNISGTNGDQIHDPTVLPLGREREEREREEREREIPLSAAQDTEWTPGQA
jgi:hypothetical protein